ncbi:MAG: hypothetical protein AAGE80_07560 [Pseudomonadota bacterium]
MKKQKRKSSQKKQNAAANANAPKVGRRDVLKLARNIGIGALVLGGIGYYSVTTVMATHAELDLERIGQGTPTVVQIHDPQCRLCQQLQSEARDALAGFESDELIYLVANIRTGPGRRLASIHGVGNVTLLLFDGQGRLRDTIEGVTPSATLEERFTRLLTASRTAPRS